MLNQHNYELFCRTTSLLAQRDKLLTLQKTSGCYSLIMLMLMTLMMVEHAPANTELVNPADCRDFINESPASVICGFVSVARDHDNPGSHQIELPILIAQSTRSLSPNNDRAILIPGAGGPGAAMGFGYRYNAGDFLAPYENLRRAGYDVIIVDQRGAGFSKPKLNCHETTEVFKNLVVRPRTLSAEITQYRKAIAACQKRLTSSIGSVSAFDTRQSAKDFLQIINNLPYRWWGTIATSYATALAQAMIMLQPDVFDSAVLDSPVPLDYQQPLTIESTYQSVIKTIKRCQQNTACHKRYPKLVSQFDSLLKSSRQQPYAIKIRVYDHTANTTRKTLIIDDNALLGIFSTAIYNNDSIAMLPSVINKMHKGSEQALKFFAEDFWYQSTDNDYADGLNVTVHCKERQILEEQYAKAHPNFLNQLSEQSRMALRAQVSLCDTWQVTSDNKLLPKTLFSTRTLILAGSLDPVISQADIDHTANNFRHATTEVVPGAGHSVWFQSECARENVLLFFNNEETPTSMQECEGSLPLFK